MSTFLRFAFEVDVIVVFVFIAFIFFFLFMDMVTDIINFIIMTVKKVIKKFKG